MKRIIIFSLLFSSTLFFMSCEMTKKSISEFNLFTIENDKQLGKEVAMEIESNPQEYPILDSAKNATAYKYLYDIRDRILNSGKVEHKNRSEEHTSELQSRPHLVCRLLLEKKKYS